MIKSDVSLSPIELEPEFYSINALSIYHIIRKQRTNEKLMYHDVTQTHKTKQGTKLYFKAFLVISPKVRTPVFCSPDSGSDISLIHQPLLSRLLSPQEIEKRKTPCKISVVSFTGDSLQIAYTIMLPWSFSPNAPSVELEFYVFNGPHDLPLVIGFKHLEFLGMDIKFSLIRAGINSLPMIYPSKLNVPGYLSKPSCTNMCSATVEIPPFEMRTVVFHPGEVHYLINGESVLISESDQPSIYIFPSRCTSLLNSKAPLVAHLTNISSRKFKGTVRAKVESLHGTEILSKREDFDSLPEENTVFNEVISVPEGPPLKNFKTLKLMQKMPPSQEKLTPLTSFLLLTPHESNYKNSYKDNPEKNQLGSSEVLEKVENFHKSKISLQERERFRKELQSKKCEYDEEEIENELEEESIPPDILAPSGYSLPTNLETTIHDIVDLQSFEKEHQPYIKSIFIEKYPEIVSLHQFDIGDLSHSLGLYNIQLKEGETLPHFRKVYFLSQEMKMHMRDILDTLIKYDIIERSSSDDDGRHLVASPAYLVGKADKSQSYRLVVDYRLLNRLISCPVPLIPDITTVLHSLRSQALFTLVDLSSAYFSVTLTPECQYLTSFACQLGKFKFKKLAMGLSSSPSYFQELAMKMVNFKPRYDRDGKPIFVKPNQMELHWDPIENATIFFDDLLVFTPLKETYEETLKHHFEIVDKVMSRLHLHKAKIGFQKSKFAQSKIKYLGWNIRNNFIVPDKKRIDKMLNAPFPVNTKGMKSFTALLNTIKMVTPHVVMEPLKVLMPLSIDRNPYEPQEKHFKAFEEIKQHLTSTPLFSNIIAPNLPKVIFTDASASKGSCYSAVLGQVETLTPEKLIVPKSLSLQDPVHRVIYNKRLCFEPLDIYFHEEFISKTELKIEKKTNPLPNLSYLDEPYLGYDEHTVKDSLFISIRSIQYEYQSRFNTSLEMRKMCIQKANDSLIIKQKILDDQFKNDLQEYKSFVEKFLQRAVQIDQKLHLITALAQALYRTIIIVSSLPEHSEKPILKFNPNVEKPPFILGLYEKGENKIFRPYFIDKDSEFNVKQLEKFEIVYFLSKLIAKEDLLKPILELELMALLYALFFFQKFLGKSELLAVTDSKALFLLYANPLHNSSTKIARWSNKLYSDHPNIKLRFVSTKTNISDFLSRDFSISPSDVKRIPFKNYCVPDLDEHLDFSKNYTIPEWKEFVNKNLHLLKIVSPEPMQVTVHSLNSLVSNMSNMTNPSKILLEKIKDENIAVQQKLQFNEIIEKCLFGANNMAEIDGNSYIYKNGLLYKLNRQGTPKIYVPRNLEGALLACFHLTLGHAGIEKMIHSLYPYYFPQKLVKMRNLAARCHACALNNYSTHKQKIGVTPLPTDVFTTVYCDLAENLNPNGPYQHLLIVVCALSGFIKAYPIRSKTAEQVLYPILFDLFQYFTIKYFVSDNGACFSEKAFLATLHILGIKKIQLASLSPSSNGIAEKGVATIKLLLKKMLSSQESFTWYHALPLVIKQYNASTCLKTGFSPLTLLHGINSSHTVSALNSPPPAKLYPLLENHKTYVQHKYEEKDKVLKFVREILHEQKIVTQEKQNKFKISTEFSVGDYVFVKDKKIVLGAARPLKSYYSADPYVVVQVKPASLLLQRIADGFQTVYHKNFVKKYSPLDATFADLPVEVREVLVHNFKDLDNLQFNKLRQLGPLDHPTGLILDYDILAETPDESITKEDFETATEILEKHTPIMTLEKYMKPSAGKLEVSNEENTPRLGQDLNKEEPSQNSFSAENNPRVRVQYQDETNLISDLPVSQKAAAPTGRKSRKRKTGAVNQNRAVTRSAKREEIQKPGDPEEDTNKSEVPADSDSESDSEPRKKVQFENE